MFSDSMNKELKDMLLNGGYAMKFEAIKYVRLQTKMGLKEAVEYIDNLISYLNPPDEFYKCKDK